MRYRVARELELEQERLIWQLRWEGFRRNLTKQQRHQLLADFAKEIIPQIEAEMKERKKRKLDSPNFVRKNSHGQHFIRRRFIVKLLGVRGEVVQLVLSGSTSQEER